MAIGYPVGTNLAHRGPGMGLTMKERKAVTRELCRDYQRADKSGRGKLLDQLVQVTGYRRSYASFLLSNWGRKIYWHGGRVIFVGDIVRPPRPRVVRRVYDERIRRYLVLFWRVQSEPCGKRLKPQLSVLIAKAEQFGEVLVGPEEKEKLERISPATIDRLLGEERRNSELRRRCTTRPGALLKRDIPIRRGMEWDENLLGFLEIDLVEHGGGSSRGEYCYSLNAVEIKSGWSEMAAVRNKAQRWVFEALQGMRDRLPFGLRGLDSDNGGEFINSHLLRYCQEEKLVFTRSRDNHSNDNCHVEQKNNVVVRAYAGYARYDTPEQLATLNELYAVLRLYLNFFQPQMKLVNRTRVGSRVIKHYDKPQTPCDRLLSMAEVPDKIKEDLRRTYQQLNPFELKRQIVHLQDKLEHLVHMRRKGRVG